MSKQETIKIGTRKSELATWQALQVSKQLSERGHKTELALLTSEGDKDRTTPLSEMGGLGVFTRTIDQALINNEIDIAVHSYKDLPTASSTPVTIAAVMERADPRDTLVAPNGTDFLNGSREEIIVATGSNRRKAQWLNRYPDHKIVNLRGNVNTRIDKVQTNKWNGAILAAAGLLRIDLGQHISQYLDWMIPAPAQGAMAVTVREDDREMQEIVSLLNHKPTMLCTAAERDFLHVMGAGCSAPVGAYARIEGNELHFKAAALTINGDQRFDFKKSVPVDDTEGLGEKAAGVLLDEGAGRVIEELK
jgi:hydroxymethylbilane synthase